MHPRSLPRPRTAGKNRTTPEGRAIARIEGNTQGLKPSQIKALSRLLTRRYPQRGGYTTEQARELAALSRSTGRQIGLLINRQGRPAMVLVGDTSSILIPELARSREGAGRLRGLRFLHTHQLSLIHI